jgi:hypothetical protein
MQSLGQAMAGRIEKGETYHLQHPKCRLAEPLAWAIVRDSASLSIIQGDAKQTRKNALDFQETLRVAGAYGRRLSNAGFLKNVLVRTVQTGFNHVDAQSRVGFTESPEKPTVHIKGQRGLRGSEKDVCSRVKPTLVALVVWLVSVPHPIRGVRP